MPRTVKKSADLAVGNPVKPENLSIQASVAWDRLVAELTDSNIQVTPGHRTILSMAATISADIADAWATVKRDGAYVNSKAGLVAHPAAKRLDALRRDYFKILTMLGLRVAVAVPSVSSEPTLEQIIQG